MANDIVRDDPYVDYVAPKTWGGVSTPPDTSGVSTVPETVIGSDEALKDTIPEQTVIGRPLDPVLAQALGPADRVAATSPLNNQDFNKEQIASLENKKDIAGQEASNLSRGQTDIARINHEAAINNHNMLFGNPEQLLKAQQALATAATLPDTDPHKAVQIAQAQKEISMNTGAKPLLDKAMADASKKDEELRAHIRQAQAERIDPDHWWNSKSTAGKITAGIGMVLGGLSGGLTRTGRNPALEVMNKAIDDDINSQRHHIDNNWKAISAEHNLNQDAFTRDMHRQTWENNFRTSALENVKFQLGEAAARTNSETVKNNAINMIEDLNKEQLVIRNNQYKLAVAAQQGELNRIRTLSAKANEDAQKLMEKDGVDYETAIQAVYTRPHYRELIGHGLAPASVAERPMLQQKAREEFAALVKGGMSPEVAQAKVLENPRYAKAFAEPGVVVPQAAKSTGESAAIGRDVEGARHLGDKLAPINDTLTAIAAVKKDLGPGGALAELGQWGSGEMSARRAPGTAYNLLMPTSTPAIQADQRFDALVNKYIKDTTGAALGKEGNWEGANAGEAARLFRTIKGDGSAAARMNGVKMMEAGLEAQKQTYLQAATPNARAQMQAPQQAKPGGGLPSYATPKK